MLFFIVFELLVFFAGFALGALVTHLISKRRIDRLSAFPVQPESKTD